MKTLGVGGTGMFVVGGSCECRRWVVFDIVRVGAMYVLSLADLSGTEVTKALNIDRACDVWVRVFVFVGAMG